MNKRACLGRNVKTGFGCRIDDDARIGDDVNIGIFARIFSGAIIKRNCVIGDRCTIGHPSKLQQQRADFSSTSEKVSDLLIKDPITRIGEGSLIRSNSTIYQHVTVGKKLRTGHGVLIREHVTIGDNCVVGTQAILDGYIKMGNMSMIQSQCYIAQSVRIGEGVFIAPGCVFLDNKEIVLGKGLEGATIQDYARIGGGTNILPRVTIGKNAVIGAGSTVTKNVPQKAIAFGTPAKVKRFQTDEEIQTYINSIKTWE